jgi:hypothetical protein
MLRTRPDIVHVRDVVKAEMQKNKAKQDRLKLKTEVLTHYSPMLTCQWPGCGFNDLRALSIDHINGGGGRHTKEVGVGAGSAFYIWLKKNGFPSGFQVLCMNHQWIKRAENGEVRHSNKKQAS